MIPTTDCQGQAQRRKEQKVLVVALLAAGLLIASGLVQADNLPGVGNLQRAKVNYMLNCQGCHGATGGAAPGANVPAMENYVGNFLAVEGGREFLVQVPGSANAAISDAALAELLNWMLPTMSAAQLPTNYTIYTESEVAKLRAKPQQNVEAERARLVQQIDALAVAGEDTPE